MIRKNDIFELFLSNYSEPTYLEDRTFTIHWHPYDTNDILFDIKKRF